MCQHKALLDKLLARGDKIYWPGHAGPVKERQCFPHALICDRRAREKSILARFKAGDSTVAAIVANVCEGLDSALANAAALSVLALLAVLVRRGLVRIERAMVPRAIYRPARSNYFLSTTASSAASKPAILRGLAPKS
ncbi:MAG TPA: hypothetical protein VHT02_02940 [Methylocella sp.]|nr:hypothetical protein [Methylocella sp.]